jgi:hypothetical protein
MLPLGKYCHHKLKRKLESRSVARLSKAVSHKTDNKGKFSFNADEEGIEE